MVESGDCLTAAGAGFFSSDANALVGLEGDPLGLEGDAFAPFLGGELRLLLLFFGLFSIALLRLFLNIF